MDNCKNKRTRILTVDDEPGLLDLYRLVLEGKTPNSTECGLVQCSEGERAVQLVQDAIRENCPFCLVFMDIKLPSGNDGVWAAKEIRKIDPNIQIVFVTGLLDIDIKEISKQIPPPDKLYYLQKPFQPSEIIQFVSSLAARWQRDREYLRIKADFQNIIRSRTAEIETTNKVLKEEILKRREIEKKLRKQERQYREIIENNADAMLVLNKQGIVQYMNPAAERLFDREKEQFIGQSFGFPIASEDALEIDILKKSGSIVVGEMRTVNTERNSERSYIVSIRDITERKEMETLVKESLKNLEKTMRGTIHAVAKTVEKRDPYTSGHQTKTEAIAVKIAKKMGLPEKFIEGLSMAAMIHDIGKIAIPAEILSTPRRLSDIEFSLIKTHPEVGYDILNKIDFPFPVAEIILQHHERINGTGYPLGLQGEKINLEARIIGVADTLDAMSSHRPYRPGLGKESAIDEIKKQSGTLYDPSVVEACVHLFEADCLFE